MDNFNLKEYLAEGKLLKEEKTFNVYNDGGEPVLVNLDKATPSQEKLIRWEMPNITEPETSEEAQEIANEIMQLNSVEDVKQYYGYKRGWFNSSLKTLVGDAMVVYSNLAENKLLKEDMSLTMDELEKLANLKSDEFKSSPKKLVDMVMGSVKFNLEKDGTNIENASEDEIDKLRYKWARLKGLLKVKDTFTSMYGKRGVKTNTDKDLLDKIKIK
tara:strand:- start:574 stop:1218 length:645 start_codon:yes stop_codon:yes gene_type:complete